MSVLELCGKMTVKHLTCLESCNFRIGIRKNMEDFLQAAWLVPVVWLCVPEQQRVGFQ